MVGLDTQRITHPCSVTKSLVVNLSICEFAPVENKQVLVGGGRVAGSFFKIVEDGQAASALAKEHAT